MKDIKIYLKITTICLIISIILLIFLDRIVGNKLNNLYQGWNHKGYRGLVKEPKKIDHKRIAFFGGSVAGGYGLNYRDSMSYILEQKLFNKKFDTVNLALSGHATHGILNAVKDYNYLDYDIAIIHNGYNDCTLKGYNFTSRNNNPIYKYFKYYPILQLYIPEKTQLLLNKDDPNALDNYYKKKQKRKELKNLNNPTSNELVGSSLCKTIFDKKIKIAFNRSEFVDHLNSFSLANYEKILEFLTKNNKQIIVIIQPKYGADPLQEIQSQLIIKLVKKYKNVKLLNLSDKINLNDPKISFDQIHNTRLGNELTVQFLLPLIN